MQHLAEKILAKVVYNRDLKGEGEKKLVKGSSISLPVIDEDATRREMERLVSQSLLRISTEQLLAELKESVVSMKSSFILSHNGFKSAKGTVSGRKVTVADMYAFSIAAAYCFDSLPRGDRKSDARIGIGVMAPAIQDCGKNLIRLIWTSAGFDVIDLGNTVKPTTWVNEITRYGLSAMGISCMTNKCIDNVRKLFGTLAQIGTKLPVIIGGIATNRVMAHELARDYGIPVYYGQDVKDAVEVLEKALAKKPIDVPTIKDTESIEIPSHLAPLVEPYGFKLFRIGISDIAVNGDARKGCAWCSGDKRILCPLEIGYAKQKSLEISHAFVESFKFAVMVAADFPDESDRPTCKSMWEGLLRVEQHFSSAYNAAHAFKFPMTCPFCLPKDCRLQRGECTFPAFYRPLHEEYNLNIPQTLENVFGEGKPTGIYSIILVQ